VSSYDVQVNAIVKAMGEFVSKLGSKLNLDIVGQLKKDTPIDTGWARINWIPSIGKTVDTTAGTRGQAELGQLDSSPQSNGIAQLLAGYNIRMGNIFITNNVNYIGKLNDGSSSQAPRAFVQQAIERAITNNGGR
jgi:hypothetical protein